MFCRNVEQKSEKNYTKCCVIFMLLFYRGSEWLWRWVGDRKKLKKLNCPLIKIHYYFMLFAFLFQGTFRLSCEHVLKSLKRGRETLLTLLEAFVYDPLVDWAVGEDNATGGLANLGTGAEKGTNSATTDLTAARKQLEREVTRDTLAIRFTEIKTDWTQNR